MGEKVEITSKSYLSLFKVKKLCDEARTLLYDERITLKSALYLTNVSKETQKNILETYGVKGVNTIFRLKLLTKEGDLTLEQIKRKIEEVEKIVPEGTSFTFTVSGKIANSFISHVLDFKRTIATELACRHLGKFNKVFKVRGNNKDLQIYLEKEMVDPIELKKLLSSTISEMARIK